MVAALRPAKGSDVGDEVFILTAHDIHSEARRLLQSL
jgi:hypothetical protein